MIVEFVAGFKRPNDLFDKKMNIMNAPTAFDFTLWGKLQTN